MAQKGSHVVLCAALKIILIGMSELDRNRISVEDKRGLIINIANIIVLSYLDNLI